MAENLLSDARVRAATHERDGAYLPDGGGLRIRLLPPSRLHPKGARLAEYHFKVKDPTTGAYKNGALHLGTLGDDWTDEAGATRPFTLADARRRRNAARENLAKGLDPRVAQRVAHAEAAEAQRQRVLELDARQTVRQAFDKWLRLYVAHNRKDGGRQVESLFNAHVLPRMGDTPLAELRKDQIVAALHAVVETGKRRTANMLVQVIRQFALWCIDHELLQKDPTHRLSARNVGGKTRPRQRTLTPLEIVELRDALPAAKLPERIELALWVLLATGARVGELASAKRVELDLEAGTWWLPATKNGRPHLVHLSAFALERMKALDRLADGSAYVLPARLPKVKDPAAPRKDQPMDANAIAHAVRDRQRDEPLAGRSKAAATLILTHGRWTPHDLRRTMATQMRETLRVSSDTVERCLNHTPAGIVGTYQTGELLAERKAAFDAWGQELERLHALERTNVVELPARSAA